MSLEIWKSILIFCFILGAGCCPGTAVINNEQLMTVRITNGTTGNIIDGATIILASVERRYDLRDLLDDAEYLEQFRDVAADSGALGEAAVVVESMSSCSCIPCDFHQDTVTGQEYLALVETVSEMEILRFTATVSQQVDGESFALEVLAIGEAVPAVE